MTRYLLIIGLLLPTFSVVGNSASAEMVLTRWSFAGQLNYGNAVPNLPASNYRPDYFEVPLATRSGLGTQGTAEVGWWGGTGWTSAAPNLQFSVTAKPGVTASFSNIASFNYISESSNSAPNTGPSFIDWQYSIDNGTTFIPIVSNVAINITSTIQTTGPVALSGITALQNFSGTAIFRLSAGANGFGGANGFFVLTNNFTINGTAVPEPTSFLLAGLAGAGGLVGARFRRRKATQDDAAVPCEAAE